MSARDAASALAERASATIIAFWGVAATNMAAMVAGLYLGNDLRSIDSPGVATGQVMMGSEVAYGMAGLAKLVALAVAGVLFLRWFYGAHQNLSRFDGQRPEYHSKWTIWGFLVPVLNVSRPQRLMREVWNITDDQWNQQTVGPEVTRPTDWVNLWWGMFLAASTLGNLVSLAAYRATTVSDRLVVTWWTMFADAFGMIAVLVAISLVRNVTELQSHVLANVPSMSNA